MAGYIYSTVKPRNYFTPILVIVFSLLSLVAGFMISFGIMEVNLILIGLIFACAVLLMPLEPIYWGVAILCFLVVGQLEYFAGISRATWLPYLIGFGLYFRIPLEYLKSLRNHNAPPLKFPVLCVPLYLFLGSIVISSIANFTSAAQFLAGCRSYIACWSFLFLLLINYSKTISLLEELWKKIFIVAVIQLPLVLYQFFVIIPTRSTAGGRHGVAWDAVVGGFGGDPMGGGLSGAMAYFLVLTLAFFVLLWRKNQAHIGTVIMIAFLVMLTIILAEVKVVVVLVPVAMTLIYRRDFIRNPAIFILTLTLAFGFIVIILVAYQISYSHGAMSFDLMEMFDSAFGYSLDASLFNRETGQLSRAAALVFWWDNNGLDDLIHFLFGYGPGASNKSSVAEGVLTQKYGWTINTTTASQILWDLGAFGLLSYVGIILLGAWRAFQLVKTVANNSFSNIVLDSSGVGLVIMLIMIPYGCELLNSSALQFLLTSMLAYVGVFDMIKQKDKKVSILL